MAKREGQLYDNWKGSVISWQYCRNNPEYEKQLSQKEANHTTGRKFTLLCVLFIIGFIALLTIKTY